MAITIPIEVQTPPSYNANLEYLQEHVSRFAQALVNELATNSRPHRKMTLAEVKTNSIALEESERRLTELIHNHYHPDK